MSPCFRLHFWPVLLVTASFAAAQKPPARPAKVDDAAALEAAIRAVDRAKEKPSPTPGGSDPTPGDTATPAQPADPQPEAARPPAKPASKAPKAAPGEAAPKSASAAAATQTQITGLEDAELDNVRNVITFRKNVVVDRPDLKIWCDQLEILLNRKPAKAVPDSPKAKKSDDGDAFGSETIKTATATAPAGGFVVVWRKTETGDVVAVGRRAVYAAADGTFTITGLPEVLRDMTLHFHSPGETDKLVLYKNGNARGSKKQDFNLSTVRAKEIRQRMFSHVPGRRPAEASASGPEASAPPPDKLPPPPAPPAVAVPSAKPAAPN